MKTRSNIIRLAGASLAGALLLALPAAAAANDRELWVNVKFGESEAGSIGGIADQALGGKEDAKAYEVGYRLNNVLGFQAGYHDLGRFPGIGVPCRLAAAQCPALVVPIEGETVAYSLTWVPQLPLTRSIALFVKGGIVAWESEVSTVLNNSSEVLDTFSEQDLIYGAGLRFRLFGRLSLFYELEYMGSDIDAQYLGASFHF